MATAAAELTVWRKQRADIDNDAGLTALTDGINLEHYAIYQHDNLRVSLCSKYDYPSLPIGRRFHVRCTQ